MVRVRVRQVVVMVMFRVSLQEIDVLYVPESGINVTVCALKTD